MIVKILLGMVESMEFGVVRLLSYFSESKM